MFDVAITAIQLFGIGFTLGLSAQCFLVCAPFILPFVASVDDDWRKSLRDAALLISGRLSAYIFLGALAGASGGLIDRVLGSAGISYLKLFAGITIVILGLFIMLGAAPTMRFCEVMRKSKFVKGSLFLVGVVIGLVPCLPLLSVVFEITLISKSLFQGAFYALFFGLGTSLASFILIGPSASLLGHFTSKTVKAPKAQGLLRFACGFLIIAFGIHFLRTFSL